MSLSNLVELDQVGGEHGVPTGVDGASKIEHEVDMRMKQECQRIRLRMTI